MKTDFFSALLGSVLMAGMLALAAVCTWNSGKAWLECRNGGVLLDGPMGWQCVKMK